MRREQIGECTLYLGDCNRALYRTGAADTIITDPVWPNCPEGMLTGADGNQYGLLEDFLSGSSVYTVVVILGFDSDPRFLNAIPNRWQFVRSQQLPYAMPGYRGRLLGGDEVAYAFGQIPHGTGLIPGRLRVVSTPKSQRATGHPCPRADVHMEQLAAWWSPVGGTVLDPFMGTGATAIGCIAAGRKFIGCEIDERYFDIACKRIEAAYAQQRLFV